LHAGYRDLSEEDLSPSVPPASRGAGYWMFIRDTAREYGLRVDEQVDERRDLE
jgi:membrane-bound lytic murein transglycosylase D